MERITIKVLVVCFCLLSSVVARAEIELTPQWTERYLFKHYPFLLKNSHTDHVLAFYYFGGYKDFTIMGMERVKGADYEAYNTVLIFKDSKLIGYYEKLATFPASVNAQGLVKFPANNDVEADINLEDGVYPEIAFSREKKLFPNDFAVSEYVDVTTLVSK